MRIAYNYLPRSAFLLPFGFVHGRAFRDLLSRTGLEGGSGREWASGMKIKERGCQWDEISKARLADGDKKNLVALENNLTLFLEYSKIANPHG